MFAKFRGGKILSEAQSQIHDLLSRHVLLGLSRWQRSIRPSTRPVLKAFSEGLKFRRQASEWHEEQKRSWILTQLRSTLRDAQKDTRFYKELFFKIGFDAQADFSFEDFARLPVLEREQIQEQALDLMSVSCDKKKARRDATGGSTGVPTEIWLGPTERGWSESGMEYFFERLNVPAGTRTALFWGHNLDPQAPTSLRDRYVGFVDNTRWFDCLRLSGDVLDDVHEQLQRWKPQLVIAYASALGHLAERVLEKNHKPNYPTRCFITGGEKLWPRHRDLIERAFARPIHERYGGRDVSCVGIQLENERTTPFTVDWANVLTEPETSDPDSPLLVTKLHADAMPMIRYRVGDIARFPPTSRPGAPTFVLEEVLGRDVDRIWLPNGRWISGLQIPHLLKDFPIREFLFLQRADYSIELQIVPQDGFDESCLKIIRGTVTANLPDLDVKIILRERIIRTQANKWRPVISEVSEATGGK